MDHEGADPVREIIKQLQAPVPDLSTLLSLLAGPLDCLGLLPPRFQQNNANPLPKGAVHIARHIPSMQRAIVEHIYPTWEPVLSQDGSQCLLQQYFCPDTFHFALHTSGSVALQAYSTLLSTCLSQQCIMLLEMLTQSYPVDRLHSAIFSATRTEVRVEMTWEDYIQNVVAVPAKVANYVGTGAIPVILQQGNYFNHLSTRCECLIYSLSSEGARKRGSSTSLTYLLTKLVNLGLFPSSIPELPSQSSFFHTALPVIRKRAVVEQDQNYCAFWSELLFGMPSTLTIQAILSSLFFSLEGMDFELESDPLHRGTVKREALFLRAFLGDPEMYSTEQCEVVFSVVLGRDFTIAHARVFVCWLSSVSNSKTLESFLDELITKWSSADHVKHSLLSRHRYLTSLLVLSLSYLDQGSPYLSSMATTGRFITGVGSYINHLDNSVRLCGMLAAEIVASSSGRQLDFGVWEGNEPSKTWARSLRELLRSRDRDVDLSTLPENDHVHPDSTATPDAPESAPAASIIVNAAGYDSDDSMTGYQSPSSSRSPSPTPSELDEREKDPSLNVTTKKVQRPVYLAQLGELLRGSNAFNGTDSAHEADQMEMALIHGEDLIRRKQFFGTELEENAVNLVHGYLNLTDKFELDNFNKHCQAGLVALVACSPTKAAPSIVEEFFKNQYSIEHRHMMLNALVLGAQELSGLPKVPSFPSKALPPALHDKYAPQIAAGPVPRLLADVVQSVYREEKDTSTNEANRPRERRLRIRQPVGISENVDEAPPKAATFTSVAAEHFLGPLLNRFWIFLRDEQTREDRTAHLKGRQQYYGAGTGLILNPIVLGYFINSLCVLMHLARHAPEWSAVLAPDALELAVSVGTKPVSRLEEEEGSEDLGDERSDAVNKKQASILTSVLELILVVLDSALDLDEGRSLSLEHTSLMLGIREWTASLFTHLDSGLRAQGSGGSAETNLPRACANVVIKADLIINKWKRSMIDIL
ncbi:hypothetical protein BDZ89DRAFT_1005984, partial [Hymenopellis radicata]